MLINSIFEISDSKPYFFANFRPFKALPKYLLILGYFWRSKKNSRLSPKTFWVWEFFENKIRFNFHREKKKTGEIFWINYWDNFFSRDLKVSSLNVFIRYSFYTLSRFILILSFLSLSFLNAFTVWIIKL